MGDLSGSRTSRIIRPPLSRDRRSLPAQVVYVGVSSNEESLATDPAYPCCSFHGSVVALDAVNGRMLWKTYTVPDNGEAPGGYSGGACGQPPAIDPAAGVLYVGTGNNYDVPQSVKDCLASADPASQSLCFAPDDYFDAALSLDLRTGAVHWAHRLQGFDVWTVACLTNTNPVACPVPSSPDFDLGGSGRISCQAWSVLARRAASTGH